METPVPQPILLPVSRATHTHIMNIQTLISDEVQLGLALTAFSNAHNLDNDWPIKYMIYLRNAGITSMAYLQQGCAQNTINLDLELFDISSTELLSEDIIAKLRSFLPGPVGFRCFRLAQKAAEKVAYGTAQTEYVNRPANGKKGDEMWNLSSTQSWTLNVDCAGFVRNCLKHVTKNPFRMLLSDRDFMRAKDFYGFFTSLPYTVLDTDPTIAEDTSGNDPNGTTSGHNHSHHDMRTLGFMNAAGPNTMSWRRVPDLRMVIPGDVIVYRPKGNAAGGAAFTEYDRKDLSKLCKAVKAAQLYRIMKDEWDRNHLLVEPRNVMKDPSVQPWAKAVEAKLNAIGISTVKHLLIALNGLKKFKPPEGESQKRMGDMLNQHLKQAGFSPLKYDTIQLMYECATTTALNTGHIVFAAGICVDMGNSNNEYRIRVVHSTKFGKKDINGVVTTGVQEHYRRFKLIQETAIDPVTGQDVVVREFWTRTPREVSTTTTATSLAQQQKQQADLMMSTKSECGSVNGIQSMTSNVSIGDNNNGTVAPDDYSTRPDEVFIHHNAETSTTPSNNASSHCGAISEDDADDANDDMEEEEGENALHAGTAATVSTGSGSSPNDRSSMDAVHASLESTVVTVPPEEDEEEEAVRIKPTDELSGQSEIIVVAARMCF